jgi:hypothetical protein
LNRSTDGLTSLPVAVAERAGPGWISQRLDGQSAWIDFSGPPGSIEHVSYSDVRLGETKPGTFRDKIVVVGATAPVLQDVHPSSTSGDGEMSGPEIQAHAIATVLDGFPLQPVLDVTRRPPDRPARRVGAAVGLRLSAIPTLGLAALTGAMYLGSVQSPSTAVRSCRSSTRWPRSASRRSGRSPSIT